MRLGLEILLVGFAPLYPPYALCCHGAVRFGRTGVRGVPDSEIPLESPFVKVGWVPALCSGTLPGV